MPGAHGTREMPLWGPIFSEVCWDQDPGRVRVYSLAKYLEEIQARCSRVGAWEISPRQSTKEWSKRRRLDLEQSLNSP